MTYIHSKSLITFLRAETKYAASGWHRARPYSSYLSLLTSQFPPPRGSRRGLYHLISTSLTE